MGLNRIIIALLLPAILVSCIKSTDGSSEKTEPTRVVMLNVTPADFASSKSSFTANADETEFRTQWENGDRILVNYTIDGTPGSAVAVKENDGFAVNLPDRRGNWTYSLVYGNFDEETGYLNFSSSRTQFSYGETYDIMASDLVSAENALSGEDENGDRLVFHMKRLTSTLYFHLTSSLTENVKSVSIEIEGDFPIGGDVLGIGYGEDGLAFLKVISDGEGSGTYNTITLTPAGEICCSDFVVAVNLLPVSFNSFNLSVELEGGTMLGLKRLVGGNYESGEMYYVKKGISYDKSFVYELGMTSAGRFLDKAYTVGNVGNEGYEYGGELVTRSSIGEKNPYTEEIDINFTKGDLFDVFNSYGKEQFTANRTYTTCSAKGKIKSADSYYILYPSAPESRISGGRIHTSLPSGQTLNAEGVDPKALVSAGACSNNGIHSIRMKQVCSMLRFSTAFDWTELVISSDIPLAGDAVIKALTTEPYAEPGENTVNSITVLKPVNSTDGVYSVCLFPLLHPNGLTLTFYNGDSQVLSRTIGLTTGGLLFKESEAWNLGLISFPS